MSFESDLKFGSFWSQNLLVIPGLSQQVNEFPGSKMVRVHFHKTAYFL